LGSSFSFGYIRSGDEFVDLDDRAHRANGCGDVLVSIPFNSGHSSLRGPETFYWRVDNYSIAKHIQQHPAAAIPGESGNRGLVRRRLRLTRKFLHPLRPRRMRLSVKSRRSPSVSRSRLPGPAARAIADSIWEQSARGDAGMGPLPRHIDAPPNRATDARE
jgi:N-acetylmuramoyl-L-alanine amidase